jgi:hypothetical protein
VRFVSEWRQNGATSASRRAAISARTALEDSPRDDPERIKAKPDMTLVQIAEMLEAETGAVCAELGLALSTVTPSPSKNRARSRAGQARRRRRPRLGVNLRRVSIPTSWYSSTRLVVLIANQIRAY